MSAAVVEIDCPEDKAEGECLGYPYNTELVNSRGVNVHFWLGAEVGFTLAVRLCRRMERERDVVSCSYSDGRPTGFWARQDVL